MQFLYLGLPVVLLLLLAKNLNAADVVGQTESTTGTLKNNVVAQQVLNKVNKTFIEPFIGNGSVGGILERLIPDSVGQVRSVDSDAAVVAAAPFLNTLANLLPGLRFLSYQCFN